MKIYTSKDYKRGGVTWNYINFPSENDHTLTLTHVETLYRASSFKDGQRLTINLVLNNEQRQLIEDVQAIVLTHFDKKSSECYDLFKTRDRNTFLPVQVADDVQLSNFNGEIEDIYSGSDVSVKLRAKFNRMGSKNSLRFILNAVKIHSQKRTNNNYLFTDNED